VRQGGAMSVIDFVSAVSTSAAVAFFFQPVIQSRRGAAGLFLLLMF